MSAARRPLRSCPARLLGMALILLGATSATAVTKTVQVGPGGTLTFSPATVTVNVGDTVEGQWMSGTHTTTRSEPPETWDSGIVSAPHVFSHTFTEVGTFPYVCTIHQALGMTGTVKVQAGAVTTTTLVRRGSTTTTTTESVPLASCG